MTRADKGSSATGPSPTTRQPGPTTSQTRKLAAILAADVVGYSRLASADEEGVLARLRAAKRQRPAHLDRNRRASLGRSL